MANLALFCSGNGSNFQAISDYILSNSTHNIVTMICNKKGAYAFTRADNLGIKSYYISYKNREREDVELELVSYLNSLNVDLIALAGYMKMLTPILIDAFSDKIVNIHPALLPKYPGCHGIEDSFNSGDSKLGITIHKVDYGMDSGPLIYQSHFIRKENDSLDNIEKEIHKLEHNEYPKIVLNLLNELDRN